MDLGAILGGLLKVILEAIGIRDLVFKKQTKIEQGESETIRMDRTEVRTDRTRLDSLRNRYPAILLAVLILPVLSGCGSVEKERIEQKPVFVQEHDVVNAAMVTDDREILVLVFNEKGEPAGEGALPAPVRIDGKVVVGPVRFKELIANEKTLALFLQRLDQESDEVRNRLLSPAPD